jgi:hypothetical protein
MDPTLIHDPNWSGVALFFVLMAVAVLGAVFFNRSTNGDWIDEHQGRGSIDDPWGLPR